MNVSFARLLQTWKSRALKKNTGKLILKRRMNLQKTKARKETQMQSQKEKEVAKIIHIATAHSSSPLRLCLSSCRMVNQVGDSKHTRSKERKKLQLTKRSITRSSRPIKPNMRRIFRKKLEGWRGLFLTTKTIIIRYICNILRPMSFIKFSPAMIETSWAIVTEFNILFSSGTSFEWGWEEGGEDETEGGVAKEKASCQKVTSFALLSWIVESYMYILQNFFI